MAAMHRGIAVLPRLPGVSGDALMSIKHVAQTHMTAALLVPLYSCALSMRNHQPWNRKELYLSILIAGIGWITNHFVSLNFPNQSDISAAVGAAAVGVVANLYGRFAKSGHGNAFVVMVNFI